MNHPCHMFSATNRIRIRQMCPHKIKRSNENRPRWKQDIFQSNCMRSISSSRSSRANTITQIRLINLLHRIDAHDLRNRTSKAIGLNIVNIWQLIWIIFTLFFFLLHFAQSIKIVVRFIDIQDQELFELHVFSPLYH